ncbi:MAG: M23 family metallopeptidase [Candidatus Sumerlaeaceae bacterium]
MVVAGISRRGSRLARTAYRWGVLGLLCASTCTGFAQADEAGGALPVVSARYDNAVTNNTALQHLKIKLPFQAGKTFEVFQGNSGAFTHTKFNQYAWDFGLPEGTPVSAAAEGRVVRVKQDSSSGGTSPEQYALANTVVIDHGNGLFTQYLHLKRASVLVNEGQLVQAGQVIALSGNTGFSSVPHLHFQVQDASGQSVPARFEDVGGDGVPRHGQEYTSANDGTGTTRYVTESRLPPNAFERNSIELTQCDLPAHLLRCDATYRISGRIFTQSSKVAVFLMGARGGKAVLSVFAPVNKDGTFSAELRLNELKQSMQSWSSLPTQSNTFSFAIAPVKADGSFWTNFSIPVCLR